MSVAIVWFRRDLRLTDNPALEHAIRLHDGVVPLYVHAPDEETPWSPGAASRWWLNRSLEALDAELRHRGTRLVIRAGESLSELRAVLCESGASAVYWNRLYDPAITLRDTRIKEELRDEGVEVWSGNASLLFEPWTVRTAAGQPYRVFSPFWRACRLRFPAPELSPSPDALQAVPAGVASVNPATLLLAPSDPWDTGISETWNPGEHGAWENLQRFMSEALAAYVSGRDYPARPLTSRLSPHLHFGEIGPRQIAAVVLSLSTVTPGLENATEKYLSELGWREFAHHLLFHFPDLPERPLNKRFAVFPWRDSAEDYFQAWRRGATGFPIVDAGMRELWHTGWMHNRVRMIVGSFLTKNLRLPWQLGAKWFWDTLVDADLASNSFGWQWISGCGADAAPFFRVFNPVRQGEKFDTDGCYVRRWVPELARMPAKHIHAPWACPAEILATAQIRLGDTYPRPVVDLRKSRKEALDAYQTIKSPR